MFWAIQYLKHKQNTATKVQDTSSQTIMQNQWISLKNWKEILENTQTSAIKEEILNWAQKSELNRICIHVKV